MKLISIILMVTTMICMIIANNKIKCVATTQLPPNSSIDVNLLNNIEELKTKIKDLETIVESKENDLHSLKESLETNLRFYNHLIDDLNINSNQSNAIKEQLLNNDVQLPYLIDLLPHLNGRLSNVQPKFKLTKNKFSKLVIGIPTIKRDKTSYLLETVKSLFDSMSEKERADVLVVIVIAEMQDSDFIQKTIESITALFNSYIENGLLDIIVPPITFYPNLDKIAQDSLNNNIYNDPFERIKWRTKQNYDFAYLMTYAQRRGVYYLQIEDDVVSKAGCVSTILDFIHKQKSDKWLILEFTQLGFIGKLFKTKDLPLFINFFLMFSADKPVDWLSDSVFDVRACDPERGAVTCERSKLELKSRYKPSLFQHVGLQSSLKGKTQKLRDKDFGKQLVVIKKHNNPKCSIKTSLKTYMKYTIDGVYLGHNYFWSFAPIAKDFILFTFETPIILKSYYIKSGNPEHPEDKLFNTTLQIKPVDQSKTIDELKYSKTSDGFYVVGKFANDIGIATGDIDYSAFGKISDFRINVDIASSNWILISEIDFSNFVFD